MGNSVVENYTCNSRIDNLKNEFKSILHETNNYEAYAHDKDCPLLGIQIVIPQIYTGPYSWIEFVSLHQPVCVYTSRS